MATNDSMMDRRMDRPTNTGTQRRGAKRFIGSVSLGRPRLHQVSTRFKTRLFWA